MDKPSRGSLLRPSTSSMAMEESVRYSGQKDDDTERDEYIDLTKDPECYMCNKCLTDNCKSYSVLDQLPSSNIFVVQKIAEVVGDCFVTMVCKEDTICNNCYELLSQLHNMHTRVFDILAQTHQLTKVDDSAPIELAEPVIPPTEKSCNEPPSGLQIKSNKLSEYPSATIVNKNNKLNIGLPSSVPSRSPKPNYTEISSASLPKCSVASPNVNSNKVKPVIEISKTKTINKSPNVNIQTPVISNVNIPIPNTNASSKKCMIKSIQKVENVRISRKRQFGQGKDGIPNNLIKITSTGSVPRILYPESATTPKRKCQTEIIKHNNDPLGRIPKKDTKSQALILQNNKVLPIENNQQSKSESTQSCKKLVPEKKLDKKPPGKNLYEMKATTAQNFGQCAKVIPVVNSKEETVVNNTPINTSSSLEPSDNRTYILLENAPGNVSCIGEQTKEEIITPSEKNTINSNVDNLPLVTTESYILETKEQKEKSSNSTPLKNETHEMETKIKMEVKREFSSEELNNTQALQNTTMKIEGCDFEVQNIFIQSEDTTTKNETLVHQSTNSVHKQNDSLNNQNDNTLLPIESKDLKEESIDIDNLITIRVDKSDDSRQHGIQSIPIVEELPTENSNSETLTSESLNNVHSSTENSDKSDSFTTINAKESNIENNLESNLPTTQLVISSANSADNTLYVNSNQSDQIFMKISDLAPSGQYSTDQNAVTSTNNVINFTLPNYDSNLKSVNVNTTSIKEPMNETDNSKENHKSQQSVASSVIFNDNISVEDNNMTVTSGAEDSNNEQNYVTYVFEEVSEASSTAGTTTISSENVARYTFPAELKDKTIITDQGVVQNIDGAPVYQDLNDYNTIEMPVILEQLPEGYTSEGGNVVYQQIQYQQMDDNQIIYADSEFNPNNEYIFIVPSDTFVNQVNQDQT